MNPPSEPMLRKYAIEPLAEVSMTGGTEWAVLQRFGAMLEKAGLTRHGQRTAEALLYQSPFRSCFVQPVTEAGPNAALLRVRSGDLRGPAVCLATIPAGWSRRHFVHPLHLLALVAGPSGDDVAEELASRMCRILSEPAPREALVRCATAHDLVEALAGAELAVR